MSRISVVRGRETVIGMATVLGYARVNTIGQDLDAQLAALDVAGVEAAAIMATLAELELELGKERRAASRSPAGLGVYRPRNHPS